VDTDPNYPTLKLWQLPLIVAADVVSLVCDLLACRNTVPARAHRDALRGDVRFSQMHFISPGLDAFGE
jgi:hypothetical protein